jgi:3-hydroxyisobutyrate dehydrogenase-like beta-hydroxyacid dehydrogenase
MLQNMANVLVLHPGAMGASVAAALIDAGHEVAWVADGRSTATVQRAKVAGCRSFENLAAALAEVAGVVSVVPPEHALAVANLVAEADFGGWCLDANAISPSTAAETAALSGPQQTLPERPGSHSRGRAQPRLLMCSLAVASSRSWSANK